MKDLISSSEIRSHRACEQHHGGEDKTRFAIKSVICSGKVKEDQARKERKQESVF